MKKILFFISLFISCNNAHAQLWQSYADTARQAEKQRNFEATIQYDKLAMNALPPDSATSFTYIEMLKRLGENNLRVSDYANAEKYLNEGINIFNLLSIKQHPLYAILCDRMARVYEVTNPKKAAPLYTESKNITEKLFTNNSIEYAATCNNLGNYYLNSAEYNKAEAMHLEAKKIKEQKLAKDDPDYARTCNNLAAVYQATGELEKAEPLVLEAKRIRALMEPVNAHPVYAITCINLANIYADLGQYEKAESLYLEAKAIRAKLEPLQQHADYAASCNILADFYSVTKSYDKALSLYKEAMMIRERNTGNQSLDYAESCNNLATLYTDMGKYKEAEKLALTAKDIWDKSAPKESPDYAINRNNLGLLYYAMGNYASALQYFMQARKLWEENLGQSHSYYADNTAGIAKVFWGLKQFERAHQYYKDALAAQRMQVDKIFRFTSETEKQAYIQSSNRLTDEFLSFYYKDYHRSKASAVYDRLLLNRNLILSSSLQVRQGIYKSNDSILINKYEAWSLLKKELAYIYTSGKEPDSSYIKALEQQANDEEKWLTLKSAEFKKQQLLPEWQKIQQALAKDEAAVEFTSFAYYNGSKWTDSTFYAATIIRNDLAEPLMIPLFEKKQLDSLWGSREKLLDINGLYSRGVKGIKLLRKTKPLYDIVWKPLEKALGGIKKIYFTPAGDLFKISFAALAINEKQVLSDVYELVQLNSTALVGERRDELITVKDSLYFYGGIQYNADTAQIKSAISKYIGGELKTPPVNKGIKTSQHFNFLPGTLEEVTAIKSNAAGAGFNARLFTGSEAVEESFKMLDGNSAAVVHIATHGFFNEHKNISTSDGQHLKRSEDPLLRSGLLFAGAQHHFDGDLLPGYEDGIATALEISNMVLPSTKLVVLSACETALGDIRGDEGVYGLQRAFKMAGTSYLLMSLWEVGDLETAEFMKLFYGRLFLKQSIEKAFLFAQSTMKDAYRASPEKWGAWVLVK